MFTGIIEETGTVQSIDRAKVGIRMTVSASLCAVGLQKGGSLAVNGCCLTVTKKSRSSKSSALSFDLLQETWDRTSFQQLHSGSLVNLERALAASGRIDGHFVTGHIDGAGKVTEWKQVKNDYLLEVAAPPTVTPYLIEKGSIAIDGISLTIANVRKNRFQVWIIPHTLKVTNLKERKTGDWVNLEADILGKYARKFATRGK